VKDIEYRVRRC